MSEIEQVEPLELSFDAPVGIPTRAILSVEHTDKQGRVLQIRQPAPSTSDAFDDLVTIPLTPTVRGRLALWLAQALS